jgi:hypothetical protein
MIIPMTTTRRPPLRYDHRLRDLVRHTGDVTIATDPGVPRSTARGGGLFHCTARVPQRGRHGAREWPWTCRHSRPGGLILRGNRVRKIRQVVHQIVQHFEVIAVIPDHAAVLDFCSGKEEADRLLI